MEPIFTQNVIENYSQNFNLADAPSIRRIKLILDGLISESKAGKLETLKEEEIKSRFVTSFFGDVLGFFYGYSENWLLREEKKTSIDGTKPDAALGYFFSDKSKDQTHAIIEVKNYNTELDIIQKREKNQTPVEQAFEYAPKMGGQCKWVIVSNIKETRFYCANDRSRCQTFFLEELEEEKKLKELLFLFHKDRFLTVNGKSHTDRFLEYISNYPQTVNKDIHIIDQIYKCLKRFEGFGFVDPNYIASLYPFNILDRNVWHYSDTEFVLFTNNRAIYDLLQEITVKDSVITISDKLKQQLRENAIIDYQSKLEWIFHFLNHCLIHNIQAVKDYKDATKKIKGVISPGPEHIYHVRDDQQVYICISIHSDKECDCLRCNYRSLDFNKFLNKLKSGTGNPENNTLEFAFANYLVATNNYKATYIIYKSLEENYKNQQNKHIEYFFVRMNLKYLHNLISYYDGKDKKEILRHIKSIDLDNTIHYDLAFCIDKDVRDYLIKVKEETLIYKVQDEIERLSGEIEKLKDLYERGGTQDGPPYVNQLCFQYHMLYLHINTNDIIYDKFTRYKSITRKVLHALLLSHETFEVGITEIPFFILCESILHINSSVLEKEFNNITRLKLAPKDIQELLILAKNLIKSYYKDGFFDKPFQNQLLQEYLLNYSFSDKIRSIFTNLFIVLSKVELRKEDVKALIPCLNSYLDLENELVWYNLQPFGDFLIAKGYLFEAKDLYGLLKIAIKKHRRYFNKYERLLRLISQAISKHHPEFKIADKGIIIKAIANCHNDEGTDKQFRPIIYLLKIVDDKNKALLLSAFEDELDSKFNTCFYDELIRKKMYDYTRKNYFLKLAQSVNKSKGQGYIGIKNGIPEFKDFTMYNFLLLIYLLDIDFIREELKVFTDLSEFEKWMINPFIYNYTNFDANWLLSIENREFVYERIKSITEIKVAVEKSLIKEYNAKLAEIYFRQLVTE